MSKPYQQKFKGEWFKDEELKDWTKLSRDKSLTASCKYCLCDLKEHKLPMILMDSMPEMLPSLDPESEILKNIKCAHSKSAYILKHALGQNALNVLINESTDISSVKSLAIVVRYYDEELEYVNDAFLTSIDIKDASSQGLCDAIIQFFTSAGIPLAKMLGFAADNCSVMMGQHRGLQARLKEVNRNLYVFGCICHSFHICASEACKRIPQAFEDLCSDIYN
ncbi:hypothetical protein M8J75_007087 [Diaphorina citri]|nr:hypothetical protein M8J75_007087 [Diaphorina citri]